MAVRDDCRHYLQRSMASGDVLRRCRLTVNTEDPFACPDGCLFFESRSVSGAGWAQAPQEPMSNTADGLMGLSAKDRKRRGKKKR